MITKKLRTSKKFSRLIVNRSPNKDYYISQFFAVFEQRVNESSVPSYQIFFRQLSFCEIRLSCLMYKHSELRIVEISTSLKMKELYFFLHTTDIFCHLLVFG